MEWWSGQVQISICVCYGIRSAPVAEIVSGVAGEPVACRAFWETVV